MNIYEKSRWILIINIVVIWYVLFVFGPSAMLIVEFSSYALLLAGTLYLVNDNIFSVIIEIIFFKKSFFGKFLYKTRKTAGR